MKPSSTLSSSILEAWASLPAEIRRALINSELGGQTDSSTTHPTEGSSFGSSLTSGSSNSSDDSGERTDISNETVEECPTSGTKVVLKPLERAPKNVFEFSKTHTKETTEVEKTPAAVVTKTTTIVTRTKGWRNVFTLPISYDVNMIPRGTLLDPTNPQLLDATGNHPEGYNRRFAVLDDQVEHLYGDKIRAYFTANGIELTSCVLKGGEADKRPAVSTFFSFSISYISIVIFVFYVLIFDGILIFTKAVDKLLDDLCVYKLRRREPFLAIGGGVLLDIAGMGACLYRRGVPFVRVPTTLLSIVDASVGVKNGVDYCCSVTDETYKNRVGSFYAPSSCLLDTSFISTQNERNICNGFGEIMKLALVRSTDLFELLETHGTALIQSKFRETPSVPDGVTDRVIDLSIQIMLEELGPNLWETKLERCVDYGKAKLDHSLFISFVAQTYTGLSRQGIRSRNYWKWYREPISCMARLLMWMDSFAASSAIYVVMFLWKPCSVSSPPCRL